MGRSSRFVIPRFLLFSWGKINIIYLIWLNASRREYAVDVGTCLGDKSGIRERETWQLIMDNNNNKTKQFYYRTGGRSV